MFTNIQITDCNDYHNCDICKTFHNVDTPATHRVDAEKGQLAVHTHVCDTHIQKWQKRQGPNAR